MKEKKMNSITIIIFTFLLIVPNLFFNYSGTVSLAENKMLATMPRFYNEDGVVNDGYVKELQSYYEDRIGFREFAVGGYMIVKDRLFHVLNDPTYFWGKDNNLFYSDEDRQIGDYSGMYKYTDEQLNNIKEDLVRFKTYVQNVGCRDVVFFLIPNKEQVYPEYYPDTINKASVDKQDRLCQYILDSSDVNILNAKDVLLEHKSEEPLYYQVYDPTHWNFNGAYYGYKYLMEALAEGNSSIKILDNKDFDIEKVEFSGLSARYAGLSWLNNSFNYKDIKYVYNIKNPRALQCEVDVEDYGLDPNTTFYHYINPMCKNEQTLLILGDSYIYSFILPWIAESYKEVYQIGNGTDVNFVKKMINLISPEKVVVEAVERTVSVGLFDWLGTF